MVSQLPRHEHTPLPPSSQRFRLARLRRVRSPCLDLGYDLRCSFVVADLADAAIIPYKALSYVWGTSAAARRIVIECYVQPECFLPITATLEAALHGIVESWDMGSDILVYVDQLCIDQSNLDEKGHQVALMGSIYRQATCVLAWLGESTPESDIFMSTPTTLPYIDPRALLDLRHKRSVEDPHAYMGWLEGVMDLQGYWGAPGIERILHTFGAEFDPEEFHKLLPFSGFLDLVSRPWFRRMWIVQEAALGPHLVFVCGSQRMDSKRFKNIIDLVLVSSLVAPEANRDPWTRWDRFWRSLEGKPWQEWNASQRWKHFLKPALPACQVLTLRSSVQSARPDTTDTRLLSLAVKFNVDAETLSPQAYKQGAAQPSGNCPFGATDPRDRVHALRGLVGPDDQQILEELPVDYHLSLLDVYRQFASAVVERNPDILLFAQHYHRPGETSNCLPSWVPDWSSQCIHPPFCSVDGHIVATAGHDLNTSGSGQSMVSKADGTNPSVLLASGVVVDTVGPVGKSQVQARPPNEDSLGWGSYEATRDRLGFFREAERFCAKALALAHPLCVASETDRDKAKWLIPTGGVGLRRRRRQRASEVDSVYPTEIFGSHDETRAQEKRFRAQDFPFWCSLKRTSYWIWPVPRLGILFDYEKAFCASYADFHWGAPNGIEILVVLLTVNSGYLDHWFDSWWTFPLFWFIWLIVRDLASRLLTKRIGVHRENGYSPEYEGAIRANAGRKCLLTHDGFVGLGPSNTTSGDVVVIIHGCSAPLVLRPLTTAGQIRRDFEAEQRSIEMEYELVGEAYIYGIMEGQFLATLGARHRMTTFRIV